MKIKFTFLLVVCMCAISFKTYSADVTVRLQVPEGTKDVYLYIHGEQGDLLGTWPGTMLIEDTDGTLFVSFESNLPGYANAIFTERENNNEISRNETGIDVKNGGYWVVDTWSNFVEYVTVRFKAPVDNPDWGNEVAAYIWGNDSDIAGEWPGTVLQSDTDGYYSYTFPKFNNNHIIFNNNKEGSSLEKRETPSLKGESSASCYWTNGNVYVDNQSKIYPVLQSNSCTPNLVTINFLPHDDWNDVAAVYVFWGNDARTQNAGTWPGELLTNKQSNGYYSYTFDLSLLPVGTEIIFNNNNGGVETIKDNISIFTDGTCWAALYDNGGYYVSSTQCPPNTGISTVKQSSVQVYPNPTSDLVYINTPEPIEEGYLFNTLGAKIKVIEKGSNQIDLSNYASGVYFLSVTLKSGGSTTHTIIKQ